MQYHVVKATADSRTSVEAIAVSNFASSAIPGGDGLASLRGFPSNGVMFMLWSNTGGLGPVVPNTSNDAALPLSLSGYHLVRPYVGGAEPNPYFSGLVEGGGLFASAVWIGTSATDIDKAAIERVVHSVTFPRLRSHSISREADALVLGQVSSYPVGSIAPFPSSHLPSDPSNTMAALGFYLVHGTRGFMPSP